MQNKVIIIRNTSLHGSQPSSVVFACKTASFGSELQASMDPRLRLLICECKSSVLRSRMTLVYWSQPSSVALCMQNSVIRTRNTSLYGSQTSPLVFCIQNSDFSNRIASLHGSQPSSVLLYIHNSDILT